MYRSVCVCKICNTFLHVWYATDISATAPLGLQTQKSRSDIKKNLVVSETHSLI